MLHSVQIADHPIFQHTPLAHCELLILRDEHCYFVCATNNTENWLFTIAAQANLRMEESIAKSGCDGLDFTTEKLKIIIWFI